MSKITQANKKAKAEGKVLKGKKAKTETAKKTKKTAEPKTPKPKVINGDRCCHCKAYTTFPDGCGHMCKLTKKPTPRKATCPKHNPKD